MSQILPTNENSKPYISPIVWDGRGQIWRIGSVSIFPTRPRFLQWLAIIPDKWKLKFVLSGTSAMNFGHYQSPKLLGSSSPMTNKHGVSRKSGTDFWRLSDRLGFFRHMKTRLKYRRQVLSISTVFFLCGTDRIDEFAVYIIRIRFIYITIIKA